MMYHVCRGLFSYLSISFLIVSVSDFVVWEASIVFSIFSIHLTSFFQFGAGRISGIYAFSLYIRCALSFPNPQHLSITMYGVGVMKIDFWIFGVVGFKPFLRKFLDKHVSVYHEQPYFSYLYFWLLLNIKRITGIIRRLHAVTGHGHQK